MSRFFRTSQTPIVDYGYQAPIEIIAGAMDARQQSYDTNKALWEQQIQAIEDTPYLKKGLGDEDAYKQLQTKYQTLIDEASTNPDFSQMGSQLDYLKREVSKDFGINGVATGLKSRHDEYYTALKELRDRREKNLINDADLYLAEQNLNKFYNESGEISGLGMQSFSDRPEVGKYALEFIAKVPEEKRDRFLKYDPKNPNSMYGYIVKETEEGKQFMNELQQYLLTIPGFQSAMARDLKYDNLINSDVVLQDDLKDRMQMISSIDNQILKLEEMKKNPKAFGTTVEEINQAINEFKNQKDSYDNPNSQDYVSNESLQMQRYLNKQVAPFSAMEYKNITRDLEADWIVKANYEHALALERQKKAKELEEAANRATFIANGQITENQIAGELSKLPENIAKADSQIQDANSKIQDIYTKGGGPSANIRMKFTNPEEYNKQVEKEKAGKQKVDGLMLGRYQAAQTGKLAEYDASLTGEDREFVQSYYDDFILAKENAATAYVQKANFEKLQEAYFPEEIKTSSGFTKAYNQYLSSVGSQSASNTAAGAGYVDVTRLKVRMSKEEFYAKLLNNEEIPGVKNTKQTKEAILKEAGITDLGLETKLIWNKNLDKNIIQPANKLINQSNIGNYTTIGGVNAGELALDHFGNEEYTTTALPVVSPTGNMQNALQLTLTSKSGKTLSLVVDPGQENAPVFQDMFMNIYQDGKAKGDRTLMDYGALGVFSNTFSGQTSMALSKAAENKGESIPLVYNGQIINIVPHVKVGDEWRYRTKIGDVYMTDENDSPIQGDIMKMFTEIGKQLMEN